MLAEGAPTLPREVGIRLAHATIQAIADRYGVDVLHVKGPIVDATLRAAERDAALGDGSALPAARASVDADVLVHPAQAKRLIEAMARHGWELAWDFDEGSLFAHAATLTHPHLPHVDIHRLFPGIERDPASAFAILAGDARRIPIAEFPVAVPSDDAHRLILLLHAVRSFGAGGERDVRHWWTEATPEQQSAVRRIAERLEAEVALAAAIGELDSVRHHRSYRLWRVLQQPHPTHRQVLMGHVAAARPREALPVLLRFLLLNKRRMDREHGGAVGLRESLAGYRAWVAQRVRGGQ